MFRLISIIAFLVTLAGIVFHCVVFARPKFDRLFGTERKWRMLDGLRVLVYLLTLLLLERKLTLITAFRKLIYLLALFSFVVLAVTGFYGQLVKGEQISGYLLMSHVTFGGILTVCLALLAVMWSENCRFDKNYLPWTHKILHSHYEAEKSEDRYEFIRKLCFWLVVVLALPLFLSVILSMFKFFGTDWQRFMEEVHRYTALTLTLIVIIHTYLLSRFKIKQDSWER